MKLTLATCRMIRGAMVCVILISGAISAGSTFLRFDFIDDLGFPGSFLFDPSVSPINKYDRMHSYPISAVSQFSYRSCNFIGSMIILEQSGNSIWGLHIANIDPSSDLNLRFAGAAFLTSLPSRPADYIFISGDHYSDRWGSRTIAALSVRLVTSEEPPASQYAAPSIISGPDSIEASEGEMVVFSVHAAGSDLKYQWFRNAVPIANEISFVYTMPHVKFSDHNALFSVSVSNQSGTVHSRNAALLINSFGGYEASNDAAAPSLGPAMWENVHQIPVDQPANGPQVSATDLSAIAGFSWSGDTLYILADVTDDNVDLQKSLEDGGDGVVALLHHGDLSQASIVPVSPRATAKARALPSGISSSVMLKNKGYSVLTKIPADLLQGDAGSNLFVFVTILVQDSDNGSAISVLSIKKPASSASSGNYHSSLPIALRGPTTRITVNNRANRALGISGHSNKAFAVMTLRKAIRHVGLPVVLNGRLVSGNSRPGVMISGKPH